LGPTPFAPVFDPKQGKNGSTVDLLKPVVATIELLLFDGCPGYASFLPRCRELVAGIAEEVQLRRVEPAEATVTERFLGSPTIRVDGPDVEPGAERREDFGLKCRLYRTHRRSSGLSQRGVRRRALMAAERNGDGDANPPALAGGVDG